MKICFIGNCIIEQLKNCPIDFSKVASDFEKRLTDLFHGPGFDMLIAVIRRRLYEALDEIKHFLGLHGVQILDRLQELQFLISDCHSD